MITANDVLTVLRSNYDTADLTDEDLLPFCQSGLDWVMRRLKTGVSPAEPLIKETAAAIARYNLFVKAVSEPERYDSYRVGDITVNCDPKEAFEREKTLRDAAVAQAVSILTDGGFYCRGY